jgi:ribosome modulation factor
MENETQEHENGWKAAIDGKSVDQNPHDEGTPEHDAWAEGWWDGWADKQW